MTLRELVFVFTDAESLLAFHQWARSYFAGAIDGSGAQLLPDLRVKVRGLYLQEVLMFAREAGELGGVIELQPQDLVPSEASPPDAPQAARSQA